MSKHILACVPLILVTLLPAQDPGRTRPNILFVFTDDHASHATPMLARPRLRYLSLAPTREFVACSVRTDILRWHGHRKRGFVAKFWSGISVVKAYSLESHAAKISVPRISCWVDARS